MQTLLSAALSNALGATVLAVLVAVVGQVCRRPALMHGLWLLVLLKLLTPPLWPLPLAAWVHAPPQPSTVAWAPREAALPVKPLALSREVSAAEVGDDGERIGPALSPSPAPEGPEKVPVQAEAAPLALLPDEAPPATVRSVSWQQVVGTGWLVGSSFWLALAGYRIQRFHRLLRFAQRAPVEWQARAHSLARRLGLSRCPTVWMVPAPVSPLVWALVGRPRLLLPTALVERLNEGQGDTLLAHELAHLRRRDHWVRIVELLAFGVYWWHPVVWWARRRLRQVEEECCDAWVVSALPGAAEVYASALVEAVTYLAGARAALPLAASGLGQMDLLKRRLTMIMRGTTPRALSPAGSLTVLGLAVFLLPLYPTWAQSEQPRQAADAPPAAGVAVTTAATSDVRADVPDTSVETTAKEKPDAAQPPRPRGGFGEAFGGGRGGSYNMETVEEAQDEVDLLRVQLDLRRAERREAQARMRQAQADKQRLVNLGERNAAGQAAVDHAVIEVEAQEARLAAKEAQVKEGELRLKQAERRLTRLRSTPPGNRGWEAPSRSPMGGGAAGNIGPGTPSNSFGRGTPGPSGGPGGGGFSGSSSGLGGGFSGGSGSGVANWGGFGAGSSSAESLSPLARQERRLTEVEKKLQNLIDELKTLRKEQSSRSGGTKP